MTIRSQRVIFAQTGPPHEVVQLLLETSPAPQAGEILVAMEMAPINPADLNYLSGTYGLKADLPATPGFEGCGRVIASGSPDSLPIGSRVRLPDGFGTWRSHAVVPSKECYRLPESIPAEQAAMAFVNPLTAWRMLHDFQTLSPGDWIVQNAANSGVGQAVIQLARHLGLHTLNLVRREPLIPELKTLGADIVLLDDADFPRQWDTSWGKKKPKLALNAVGGDSALRLGGLLDNGGKLVTYGAMSRQSLKIPNGWLIFRGLQLHGFWLTDWTARVGHERVQKSLDDLAPLLESGALKLPVGSIYPLNDIAKALQASAEDSRPGKILLDLAFPSSH
jgi:trans-2-enoyl-CoA reductase